MTYPAVFIAAITLFYSGSVAAAAYSWWSIVRKTSTIGWHLLQWVSYGVFAAGAFGAGWWLGVTGDFHNFGYLAGGSALCILIYVATLHWMLRQWPPHKESRIGLLQLLSPTLVGILEFLRRLR
jgi:hypothetical protein